MASFNKNQSKSSFLERALFRYRAPILVVFLIVTTFLGIQATGTTLTTSLEKMVPLGHEYMRNYKRHEDDLSKGNVIRIAVETTGDTILNHEFLTVLKEITDAVIQFEGVNKSKVKSLWTPNVRWADVVSGGFVGGEIIDASYDGSETSLQAVEQHIFKGMVLGELLADDFKSAIVFAPLVDFSSIGGKEIDYKKLSDQLETQVRDRFQTDTIKIHINGFGKKMGDLIDGAYGVALFFLVAVGITFFLLLFDTRCLRSATIIVMGSLFAVIWQLGIVELLRNLVLGLKESEQWADIATTYPSLSPLQFGVDPYSMLVPFLVFAIAVSHGVQMINEILFRKINDSSNLGAAKSAFRVLYIPGLLALASDSIGFITLWFIDIGVIRELAITASVGVATIVLTKLVFVPIVLSYIGVGDRAVEAVAHKRQHPSVIWHWLSYFSTVKVAVVSIVVAALLAGVGVYYKQGLKIGDLDSGAPELHPDSVYNIDNAYINQHYSVSADELVVMIETPKDECSTFKVLRIVDDFTWRLENVEGVQSTVSLTYLVKMLVGALNEMDVNWIHLPTIQSITNSAISFMALPDGIMNVHCNLLTVTVYLDDHKADTLQRVVDEVEAFAAEYDDDAVAKFVLATGNAGVEAATNQTIEQAEMTMLVLVYCVVCFMVFLTFRSWRPVVCIVVPLLLTSVLCEAVMAVLGIGIKVATLPVIALGVGIGVDYGIYIYSKLHTNMKNGLDLQTAYFETLRLTGKSVVFTAITLGLGVGTWMFSDIKFQADMGILLTFMFVWNMIGAICLLPALAYFLIGKEQPSDVKAPVLQSE